jgi:protein arginine kinase
VSAEAAAPPDLGSPAWLGSGPDCEVVISSRVRIARNLRDLPFPQRLGPAERGSVERHVMAALPGLVALRIEALNAEQRELLVAGRLAPVAFVAAGRGCLLVDGALSVSVLLNEEDHIRIQAFEPGTHLLPAAGLARAVSEAIERELELAWHDDYGFLTACPDNAGSGVRASSLCHLPALAGEGRLARWLRAAADAGVTMRGVYGEGSRAVGAFFQLSVVGGREESAGDAAGRLLALVRVLAGEEREARAAFGRAWARDKASQCRRFVEEADSATLGESLRVLSWLRLEAAMESAGAARRVDGWSAEILLDRWRSAPGANHMRAAALKKVLGRV